MSYLHPYKDVEFVLSHIVDIDALASACENEDISLELTVSILEEAAKLGSNILAPLNASGDSDGCRVEAGEVLQAEGFKEAYRQFSDGGWMSLSSEEQYGGQDLFSVISTSVNEIWQSANLSFGLCPLLTLGAMESIQSHANDAVKDRFLPKMATGEWTGTMNLTEPDAGSDLAAVKSSAVPDGDHYQISGQKIFITWGDHQMTENIIHLVLARLPGAPKGVKGISLFVVPKFNIDDSGAMGGRNRVNCLSVEHKLGIHASPTCIMEFDNAKGYLVGEANKGLSYMFTMMNHARQSVGVQGLSVSEAAYQQAVEYSKERLQGTRSDGSRIAIITHPDVRRMLMTMRSSIEAMRGFSYIASAEIDLSRHVKDEASRTKHRQRVELYTPIVKGWLTEMSQELTSLAVQVHGGMGYIEETGVAQFSRDARILTIYEGTTGIQALDFVGRKTLMDKGAEFQNLIDDIEHTVVELESNAAISPLIARKLRHSLNNAIKVRLWILDNGQEHFNAAAAVSFSYLMLAGYLCGGWVMGRSVLAAHSMLDKGEGDSAFLQSKVKSAEFYCAQILPRTDSLAAVILEGSESIMSLSEDDF